jgi:nitrite reductase/ring-hydroxylating ferredoxin subunit
MITLCHIDDIDEGASRGFEINELKIIALKKDTQLYLYENRCPHLGLNLEFQPDDFLNYDATYIQCSTHGAMFTMDTGACVLGPCKGDHLKAITFELHNGLVLIAEHCATEVKPISTRQKG